MFIVRYFGLYPLCSISNFLSSANSSSSDRAAPMFPKYTSLSLMSEFLQLVLLLQLFGIVKAFQFSFCPGFGFAVQFLEHLFEKLQSDVVDVLNFLQIKLYIFLYSFAGVVWVLADSLNAHCSRSMAAIRSLLSSKLASSVMGGKAFSQFRFIRALWISFISWMPGGNPAPNKPKFISKY